MITILIVLIGLMIVLQLVQLWFTKPSISDKLFKELQQDYNNMAVQNNRLIRKYNDINEVYARLNASIEPTIKQNDELREQLKAAIEDAQDISNKLNDCREENNIYAKHLNDSLNKNKELDKKLEALQILKDDSDFEITRLNGIIKDGAKAIIKRGRPY